jgi:hypothetical protein
LFKILEEMNDAEESKCGVEGRSERREGNSVGNQRSTFEYALFVYYTV